MKTFTRVGKTIPTYSFNFNQAPSEFTVAITGQPRGGTTMAAAVVEALGVYLGPQDDLRRYHFEDQVMHSPDLTQVYPCILSRNENFQRWGWKDPTGMESIRCLLFALRNPRVIIVFRDMLATVQGEMRFDEEFDFPRRSLTQLAAMFLQREQQIFDYISKTQVPTLLVSYERAVENPSLFIADVIRFLNVNPTPEQIEEAKSRIGRGYLVI